MNHTTTESQYDPAASKPSPAPSTTGSTGTSGITVRTGPNGQMSFRRWVSRLIFEFSLIVLDPGWIVCLSLVWFAGLRGRGKGRKRVVPLSGGEEERRVKSFKTKTKKEKPIAC